MGTFTFIGATIGATIGALGMINGAITGTVIAVFVADTGGIDRLEFVESICPHSYAAGVILGAFRVAVRILRPVANVMIVITPIKSAHVASIIIIGATFGAVTGAFRGVTGGASTGVISAGLFMMGDLVCLIGAQVYTLSFHHTGTIGRDVGTAVDKTCCLILAGISIAALSSVVGAYTSDYFITSAFNGTLGSLTYIHWFTGYVGALLEISSLALNGGAIGMIIGLRFYNTKPVGSRALFGYTAIGIVSGAIIVEGIMGFTFWQTVWMPIVGATLGSISGFIAGFLLVFADSFAMGILQGANRTNEGIKATIIAMSGGFAGSFIGSYFLSSVIFAGLIGITFSVTSVMIIFGIANSLRIHVLLNNIIANFEEVVHMLTKELQQIQSK